MNEEVKRFNGIVVDETTISQVMPEINSLARGYKFRIFAKNVFSKKLLSCLNGELPRSKELKKFLNQERNNHQLSKQILNNIKNMPKKAHGCDKISC